MASMQAYYALRERALNRLQGLEKEDFITVEIHMGICSQAAGVLDVLKAMEEAIAHKNISNVTIAKTGCAGFCAYEPLVILKKKDAGLLLTAGLRLKRQGCCCRSMC